MRILRLAVVIGLTELSGPAGVEAQQPWLPEGVAAITFCRNGKAESWISAEAAETVHREALLAHEAVHRQQAAAYPSCEEFYASITSPDRLIAVEVPAYCAQWEVERANGGRADLILPAMAERLAADGGIPERMSEILRRLRRRCGEIGGVERPLASNR
ncbi:MAG TPA: hypothetical protein VMJ30_09290 [Gemmatimonadales bacterium]|nr:hypothetical protein [Gemmatimonadales bacterium]